MVVIDWLALFSGLSAAEFVLSPFSCSCRLSQPPGFNEPIGLDILEILGLAPLRVSAFLTTSK
jgi:hypothetical protein